MLLPKFLFQKVSQGNTLSLVVTVFMYPFHSQKPSIELFDYAQIDMCRLFSFCSFYAIYSDPLLAVERGFMI